MSDKILPFAAGHIKPSPEPPPPSGSPPRVLQKWGIYPLGPEDFIVSTPVLAAIIGLLQTGTPEARKVMAEQLNEAYRTYYA